MPHETGVPDERGLRGGPPLCARDRAGVFGDGLFRLATRAARWLSRLLYRVRVGRDGREARASSTRKATVIFVMNHRSNMDYVLVTWLVADRSALSYAVGEWARVWPLSRADPGDGGLLHPAQATRNALYRRVLARYVQMATRRGHDAGDLSRRRPEPGRPGRAGRSWAC